MSTSPASQDERLARMLLASVCEPADLHVSRAVEMYGAMRCVDQPQLLPARVSDRLLEADLDEVLRQTETCASQFITPLDDCWPQSLTALGELAPLGLWVRGKLEHLELPSVAMVGARSSTRYGELMASDIAASIATAGWAVVSGGAYGIDAACHRGALAVGGVTIAVLAGGVDVAYPQSNALLFQRIAETGAIVSESPPGAVPMRHRFLIRNRIIAGLAIGTVVVEAQLRSGAIATASHATAIGRDVMALPGPVTSAASAGCHQLIRDGAVLITSAADVFELVAGDLPRHTPLEGTGL